MPRSPHYWRKEKSGQLPSRLFVFDTETRWTEHERPYRHVSHRFRLGVGMTYRLEKGKRTRCHVNRFASVNSVWDHIDRILTDGSKLYVIGHNLAFDLGILGAWQRFNADEWNFPVAIIDKGVFYLDGAFRGRAICFLDTWNYYRCSLERIGAGLGRPKLPLPDNDAGDLEWYARCTADVEITADAIDALINFVRENEYGPFGPTVASLAFHTFKRRFMSHRVLVHDNQDALRLERRSYYGGIVDTPFIGVIPASPIHELDVNSLYPDCSLGHLPHHIAGFTLRPGASQIDWLAQRYHCYADVSLRGYTRQYPFRGRNRVYHPHGEYRTVLPDPEFRLALENNHILTVHAMSYHHTAPIFRDYMLAMHRHKEEYKRQGNDAFAWVAKYLLTNLYGKTGQQSPRWMPWGEEAVGLIEARGGLEAGSLARHAVTPPRMYGFEDHYSFGEGLPSVKTRAYWGITEVLVGEGESRDSYPAIAATITSRGRCKLRGLQQAAGRRHHYYSDTDSIWVDDAGLASLRGGGHIGVKELGRLNYEGAYTSLTVHAPKDYEAVPLDEAGKPKIRRKGVRPTAQTTGEGSFAQMQFPSLLTQLSDPHECEIVVKIIEKRLHRRNDHCVVTEDGWTRPIVLPEEEHLIQ